MIGRCCPNLMPTQTLQRSSIGDYMKKTLIRKGDSVKHIKRIDWGIGEVSEVLAGGTVTVNFERAGEFKIANGTKFLISAEESSLVEIKAFQKGERVKHSKYPGWGVGEVLNDSSDDTIDIFFTNEGRKFLKNNLKVIKVVTGDDAFDIHLDNLPYEILRNEKKVDYWSPGRAIEKFIGVFPKGFQDKKYIEQERQYKIEAHELMSDVLNENTFCQLLEQSNYDEVCNRALKVANKTNLIFPNEKMALKDGLRSENNRVLFSKSLFNLLYGSSVEKGFIEYISALEEMESDKWTVGSYYLFLSNPSKYMFLKPTVTQKAAEMIHFDIKYKSTLNWSTYNAVLDLSLLLEKHLMDADLVPKDMIDVQSFMWVVASY